MVGESCAGAQGGGSSEGEVNKQSILTKQYISVIEGTAPPFVFKTFDSPNLSRLCLVRRAGSSIVQTERGEVGRVKCLEDEGGCCPFYH